MAFLAAFFAFFAIGLIPPFRLGYAEGAAAPPAALLPPGTQPARAGSFSPRCARHAGPRAMLCPWAIGSGQKKRWGSAREETAPLQSGRTYFFFAFLAFLAAFFAFFAIVPPEGVLLLPDGDSGRDRALRNETESQRFTIRCLSLPPSYQM